MLLFLNLAHCVYVKHFYDDLYMCHNETEQSRKGKITACTIKKAVNYNFKFDPGDRLRFNIEYNSKPIGVYHESILSFIRESSSTDGKFKLKIVGPEKYMISYGSKCLEYDRYGTYLLSDNCDTTNQNQTFKLIFKLKLEDEKETQSPKKPNSCFNSLSGKGTNENFHECLETSKNLVKLSKTICKGGYITSTAEYPLIGLNCVTVLD